jgi:NAD(P)-dependent dehydrogenase (short-subunit alcohol dehydrogenase family)
LKFEPDSTFEETGEDLFDRAAARNLKAAFFVTQNAISLMKSRPKPKIVNVVSALDTEETGRNVAFAASQTALVGFTESLSKALPGNFRVNGVAVSEKKTALSEHLDAELFRPKGRISEDDAARAILFLLSAEAIGLNGQTLKVE